MNGMVTNNIRDLGVGFGLYSFLLNPQGHILGDFFAYNRGERILVDTDLSQVEKIVATFDHYIIMDDVEIANLSDQLAAIGVAGPNATAVLKAAGFEVDGLNPLQVQDVTWKQATPAVIPRRARTISVLRDLDRPRKHADDLLTALQSAGAVPVGPEAPELYRIALGIPRYGQDIRERDLPQETEQAARPEFQ